jgi:hypothetical protein
MRFLIAITFLMAQQAVAAQLRVGTAAVVITPPQGSAMAGYFDERHSDGVDNDLYALSIVIEVDGTKAALVACDLVEVPRPVALRARELIAKSAGIPADHVMISATHCHTGPVVGLEKIGPWRDWDLARNLKYVEELPGLIAKSVEQANGKLTAASAFVGSGHEDRLAFNRRYFMKDGTVGWNPGKLNPNVVRPAGPIDPQVPVVYFQSTDGKPLVTYTNFAMHLDTVGGRRISADYPFTLHTLLGRLKGEQMVSLFTIGCAGNINHIDIKWHNPQHGEAEAARIGTILAGEVLKTYARLTPVQINQVKCASRVVKLDPAHVSAAEVEQAPAIIARGARAPFLQRVGAYKALDVAAHQGKPIDAEVQVVALGDDLAFVALPGEIFVELGLSIKKQSPFGHTVIAELANGNVGYVPTGEAYPQGNYEVVTSRCAQGSGEKLAETALELLKQAHDARQQQ